MSADPDRFVTVVPRTTGSGSLASVLLGLFLFLVGSGGLLVALLEGKLEAVTLLSCSAMASLGGFFLWFFVPNWLEHAPAVVLDPRGIRVQTSAWGPEYVPWTNVRGFAARSETFKLRTHHFVDVFLLDPAAHRAGLPPVTRFMTSGMTSVRIVCDAVGMPREELLNTLRVHWARATNPGQVQQAR